MMRRRDFLALVAATAVLIAPQPSHSQALGAAPVRLALVSGAVGVDQLTETGDPAYGVVLTELRRLGLIAGQNLIVERWSNAGRPESELPDFARRVAAGRPDIIYVAGSSTAAAIKAAAFAIPIVFIASDPIGWGLVESIGRPGGNVTGFAGDSGPAFYMKKLQLLTEAAQTKQVIYLFTEGTRESPLNRAVREAARQLGVDLRLAMAEGVINKASVEKALATASPAPGMALYVHPAAVLVPLAADIAAAALRLKLPTMGDGREYVAAGVVMSYDTDDDEGYIGAATYIARIAQGERAGLIPALRQISATGIPSAPCFKMNAFWASENCEAFIAFRSSQPGTRCGRL